MIDYQIKKGKVVIECNNYKGEDVKVTYDPYLFGVIKGICLRRKHNWHGLILITGAVGDGKSNLGDGICGLDALMNDSYYGIENNVFNNVEFNQFCDQLDNFGQPLKYDEAIEGTTGRDIGISSKGIAMKKKIIKKRKKKHLYVFLIDELEEYAWKFIKMADAWIHVKAYGISRGYFDITTNKTKIKEKYLHLKKKEYYQAAKIKPDKWGCTFMKYENIFMDDELYQKTKDEKTADDNSDNMTPQQKRTMRVKKMSELGLYQHQIAKIEGVSQSTIRDDLKKE